MGEIQPDKQLEMPEEEVGGVWPPGESRADVPAPDQNGTSHMGGLPVEDWDYLQPKRGEIRTGVILAITEQEIIIDVGAKRDGIVPLADMERMGAEAISGLSVGDRLPVYVLRPEDQDGNLTISLYQARQEKDWLRAKELEQSGEVWEGEVIGYNKGGLVIPLGGIRGFLPASQIATFRPNMTPDDRMVRLSGMVGEKIMVKVIELNRRKHRLILSATVAQRDWRQQQRERLLSALREGEVRRGTVSSLCPFGAFVDLGGADGLIHLSELCWQRVRHPKEVLSVGQEVEVVVLHLDQEHKRIGLSMKRLQPEPWAMVEDTYELGQLVEGVITNVAEFGAFAEIEPGVEGLIHISELADTPVAHPRDVVKKGDPVLLRIIRIDTRRKRLGLSLKRVLESEWSAWAARLAVAHPPKEPVAVEQPVAQVGEPEPSSAPLPGNRDVSQLPLPRPGTPGMGSSPTEPAAVDQPVAQAPADTQGETESSSAPSGPLPAVEMSDNGDASQLPPLGPPSAMDEGSAEAEAVEALDSAKGYEPELVVIPSEG